MRGRCIGHGAELAGPEIAHGLLDLGAVFMTNGPVPTTGSSIGSPLSTRTLRLAVGLDA